MRTKRTESSVQFMADELRAEAARLEDEAKALRKAADTLDKPKENRPSLIKEQEELLRVRDAA
jgi:hypothetical protein